MSEDTIKQVLDFICHYHQQKGFSPSQREIARGSGYSIFTIREALDILEARGKIYREPGIHRNIQLIL